MYKRQKTVRKYIILIVILTMCPAVYLTFGIIKSTFYEAAANRFINELFPLEMHHTHTDKSCEANEYGIYEVEVKGCLLYTSSTL